MTKLKENKKTLKDLLSAISSDKHFQFFRIRFFFLYHIIVFHFLFFFDDFVVEFQNFKNIFVDDSIRFNVDNDDFEFVELDFT